MANEENLIRYSQVVSQRHADHYLQKIMSGDFDKYQLRTEYDNLQLALTRLKSGEVKSEYTIQEIEEKLSEYGFEES